MDDPNKQNSEPVPRDYPVWFSLLMILFWLMGLGVLILFGFFALITLPGQSWSLGVWDLLVVLAEGWALFYAIRYYFRGSQAKSVPLLWAAVAAIALPFFATVGCALMADSLRISG